MGLDGHTSNWLYPSPVTFTIAATPTIGLDVHTVDLLYSSIATFKINSHNDRDPRD